MSAQKAAAQFAGPPETLTQYERVVATIPDVERKGASVPYTSLNGNMFSFLEADGTLALRLSREDRERFLCEFQTQLHTARGVLQKEYVDVPGALLADTPTLAKYFAQSYAYAKTLKSKPTRCPAA